MMSGMSSCAASIFAYNGLRAACGSIVVRMRFKVESPYSHPELRVTVKRPGPLWVRVPPWVDVSGIIGLGTQEPVRCVSGYLFIARPPVNAPLVLELPLAEQELTLDHRTRQIRVQLRGDEVVAMENFGADLTFFEPIG